MDHFLFLIMVGGLARLVRETSKKHLFKGVRVGSNHMLVNLL